VAIENPPLLDDVPSITCIHRGFPLATIPGGYLLLFVLGLPLYPLLIKLGFWRPNTRNTLPPHPKPMLLEKRSATETEQLERGTP